MTIERLMWHLSNWRDWMQHDKHRLGYPSKSLMIASGGGSSDDEFESMCNEADSHCASVINSVIDSISKPQQTAINHQWLGVVHCYPTQELDLDEAYTAIIKIAVRRGIV